MKKGPLSKVEKYYIENNTTSDVASLAKDLDRSEVIISKHLKTIKQETNIPDSSNLSRYYIVVSTVFWQPQPRIF